MLEVRPLPASDQRLWRRPVEPEVPDGWMVVDRLPPFDAGQERVHEHELVDVGRELCGVGVGDHQPDVVTHDSGLAQTELLHERMHPHRGT